MTPGGPRWPALRELHERLKAIFVESGGGMLPAHYGDPSGEVRAARTAATVYDASERSRILVTGTDGGEVLRAAAGETAAELEEGRSVRVGLLNAAGTLRDLALVSRTGGIAWLLSGEPGQRFETLARLRRAVKPGFDARVEDRTETTCVIALCGPQASAPAGQHVLASLPARLRLSMLSPSSSTAFALWPFAPGPSARMGSSSSSPPGRRLTFSRR